MTISENSRIWIYQSDKIFSADETAYVQQQLDGFTAQWLAHGNQLAAAGEVRYNQFIILSVDEARVGATGCSIDKSVQLIKQIEQELSVNLFDRFRIAYRVGSEILSCNRDEFEQLLASGRVNEDTIVFNNLVATRKELETNWEIKMRDSWHAQVFS